MGGGGGGGDTGARRHCLFLFFGTFSHFFGFPLTKKKKHAPPAAAAFLPPTQSIPTKTQQQELGNHDESLRLLERALELRAALFSKRSLPWADAAATLAKALRAADAAALPSSRGGDGAVASARRARAVELLQAAVKVVEDAGMVEGTPVLLWDLELAEALMEEAAAAAAAAEAGGEGSGGGGSRQREQRRRRGCASAEAAVARLRAALSHFEQLRGDGSAVSGGGRVALDSPELSAGATPEERRLFGMSPDASGRAGGGGAAGGAGAGAGAGADGGGGASPPRAGGGGPGGGGDAPPGKPPPAPADGQAAMLAAASEITERLADALAAAGDVPAAREELGRCADARVRLFGRHLVVGRTLARLSALHLRDPVEEGGAQVALHMASGAVNVTEEAWQGARAARPAGGGNGSGGGGGFFGRLAAGLFGGGRQDGATKSAADLAVERARGALEVGRACVALARAHEAAAREARAAGDAASCQEGEAAAVAALQRGAEALREGQRQGVDEAGLLARAEGEAARRLRGELGRRAVPSAGAAMAAQRAAAAVDAATGVLVDIKLAQIEVLDALVGAMRAKGRADRAAVAAAAASATGDRKGWFSSSSPGGRRHGGGGSNSTHAEDSDDVKMLLLEAETIAGELYGSD